MGGSTRYVAARSFRACSDFTLYSTSFFHYRRLRLSCIFRRHILQVSSFTSFNGYQIHACLSSFSPLPSPSLPSPLKLPLSPTSIAGNSNLLLLTPISCLLS